jgi:hypothetical protein
MLLPIDCAYSSCARKVSANPITGSVCVTFTSGPKPYYFEGVSRRAILKAIALPPISVGQWINRHCLARTVVLQPLY